MRAYCNPHILKIFFSYFLFGLEMQILAGEKLEKNIKGGLKQNF
jgi:hypothetical protein